MNININVLERNVLLNVIWGFSAKTIIKQLDIFQTLYFFNK